MFQPVGGIDALPYAMAKQLNSLEADFCICTTPASVLKNIPSDLSAPYREALSRITYGASNDSRTGVELMIPIT